jgi:hypothetical protein
MAVRTNIPTITAASVTFFISPSQDIVIRDKKGLPLFVSNALAVDSR